MQRQDLCHVHFVWPHPAMYSPHLLVYFDLFAPLYSASNAHQLWCMQRTRSTPSRCCRADAAEWRVTDVVGPLQVTLPSRLSTTLLVGLVRWTYGFHSKARLRKVALSDAIWAPLWPAIVPDSCRCHSESEIHSLDLPSLAQVAFPVTKLRAVGV